ncbi:MAG: nitrile hydratase subunit beta [Pseudomonadales bacterium]|nr:nitrile hydratase subunit beta [Pseudomonadales bacterium]
MDGIHDLGGRQGFGPIATAGDPVPLPERWQGFVFALVNQLLREGIAANVDHFRHSVERIEPSNYLSDGYYGRWLGGAETLLIESAVISRAEVESRLPAQNNVAARPSAAPDQFSAPPKDEQSPSTALRQSSQPAKFEVGAAVLTAKHGASGHSRLPAYARNCIGTIVSVNGVWVYPDTHAHGKGEAPEYLYTVCFQGADLFGEECDQDVEVCLDLFEPYLSDPS